MKAYKNIGEAVGGKHDKIAPVGTDKHAPLKTA